MLSQLVPSRSQGKSRTAGLDWACTGLLVAKLACVRGVLAATEGRCRTGLFAVEFGC